MDKRKILVVDDEIHIVQVVAIKLRNNGYDVFTAENGRRAYELACEHNPDVVVTDLQMPLVNGLELTEMLRDNPQMASVPVIMLTARGFSVEEDKQDRLNICRTLSKPFSPRDVLATVNEVLEKTMAATTD